MVLAILAASLLAFRHSAKVKSVQSMKARAALKKALPKRPVFPHSIVPGGVYSSEEVHEAAARDVVVAAHYAVLSSSRLRRAMLNANRAAYVSYRVNDEVYWTKRPVSLPAGEEFLTDGEYVVRARCGNRISDVPRFPVRPDEPPQIVADEILPGPDPEPVRPKVAVTGRPDPLIGLSPPDPLIAHAPPPLPPGTAGNPVAVLAPTPPKAEPLPPLEPAGLIPLPPEPPIAIVPEPNSIVLLLSAVLVMGAILLRRKRKATKIEMN